MTTLYEMTSQMIGLKAMLDDPEVDFDLTDTLDGLEGDIQDKAENLLAVVSNFGSDINQIDAEIKRLQARKKTLSGHQDRLREYLRCNMEAGGISKITCPLFSITLTKPRPVVQIDDADKIPDEYIKVTRTPVKAEILRELKAGKEIPGTSLGESKPGLMIR